MNGFDDQNDQILSDLIILDCELILRAYKLDVELIIILIYLVLKVVERQYILF